MNKIKTIEPAQCEPTNIGDKQLVHGSLFSGIGGFDLAAEQAGFENAFHCEWNEFGQKILKHYWKNSVSYGDITKTDFTIWRGRVDIVTSGFPCQDISIAGKRAGIHGERSGMFFENIRAVNEIRPRIAIWENVGEITNYLPEIIESYSEIGYCLSWYTIRASWFGLPHQRERIFGVAFNTDCIGWNEIQNEARNIEKAIYEASKREFSRATCRKIQYQDYSGFMREDDGIPEGLHSESIKAYGNSIIPQIALCIFNALKPCLFSGCH